MPGKTKISDRNSTVIPAGIRKMLDLMPGDTLLWEVREGLITIRPRKKEILDGICGLISSGGDAVSDKKRAQSGEP